VNPSPKRKRVGVCSSPPHPRKPLRDGAWGSDRCRRRTSILLSLAMALAGCRDSAPEPPAATVEPIRAVWVPRFHYRTPEDIAAIMNNIRSLGANTVLWQVRGEATVAYPSKIEPWSVEYDHRDPGFDPLKIAVDQAHKNGLKIQAWCNVAPGWKGKKPPPRGQLLAENPEWFLHDERGARQPQGDFYLVVNPCLPEVREHIVRVFEEIATNYAVDGLHMDYLRYAWDETPAARDRFPRDPWTLALYRRQADRAPDDDPQRWHHWRAAQLGQLVADVRDMLSRRRPDAMLTAAVWSSPLNGYRDYMQNAIAWLNVGLLDAVFTMTYTEEVKDFEKYVEMYRTNCPNRRVIPGIGLYKHEKQNQVLGQIKRAKLWGPDVALYAYESLFDIAGESLPPKTAEHTRSQRAMRRAAVHPFLK